MTNRGSGSAWQSVADLETTTCTVRASSFTPSSHPNHNIRFRTRIAQQPKARPYASAEAGLGENDDGNKYREPTTIFTGRCRVKELINLAKYSFPSHSHTSQTRRSLFTWRRLRTWYVVAVSARCQSTSVESLKPHDSPVTNQSYRYMNFLSLRNAMT